MLFLDHDSNVALTAFLVPSYQSPSLLNEFTKSSYTPAVSERHHQPGCPCVQQGLCNGILTGVPAPGPASPSCSPQCSQNAVLKTQISYTILLIPNPNPTSRHSVLITTWPHPGYLFSGCYPCLPHPPRTFMQSARLSQALPGNGVLSLAL